MTFLFRRSIQAIVVGFMVGVSEPARARDFVIAISPEIGSAETRKLVGASTMAFIFGPRVKAGDRVAIINALDQSQVALFVIPAHRIYESEAPRRKHLEKPTAEFINFIAKMPIVTPPAKTGVINAPQLLAHASSAISSSEVETAFDLLVVGSPIHVDTRQLQFSMLGARVPSDGHLTSAIEDSPFGLQGTGKPLNGARVHWVTLGADWQSDLHEARVRRMWAAYVDLRGGLLAAFKSDVRSVFEAFGSPDAKAIPIEPPIDRADKRLTMNIIRRDAADRAVEPLFESKEVKREPIIRTPAKLRVGLRWDRGARADIDLYAKTIGAKQWIYFGEPETPEGRFYKYEGDPTKPSKGFEYIEFNDVVDLKQVMIAINFYDGNIPGGPRGQIRLDIGGVIHEVDFQLRSSYGNKGLGFPGKMVRNPAWVVVNAADIAAGKLSFAGPGP